MLLLEIIELVIDALAEDDDMDAIRNCCLTCRCLVHKCRKYIFSKIEVVQRRIDTADPYDPLEDPEEYSPSPIPHLIERLGWLLESNPSISSYVRSLEITSARTYENTFFALHHLHQVESLKFGFCDDDYSYGTGGDWNTVFAAINTSLQSFIRQNIITTLHLFDILNLPLSILQEFQFLRHLTILRVTVEESVSMPSPATVLLPSLESLYLWADSLQFVRAAIIVSEVIDISALDSLSVHVGWSDSTDIDILYRLLQLPQSLTSLHVYMEGDTAIACRGNIISNVFPGSLQSLRNIEFSIELLERNFVNIQPYGHFEEELRIMASVPNVVEEIAFTSNVSFHNDICMEPAAWNQLDVVVSSGFPCLRKMTVDVEIDVLVPHEEAQIYAVPMQRLLDENFEWSRKNLKFVATARGGGIG